VLIDFECCRPVDQFGARGIEGGCVLRIEVGRNPSDELAEPAGERVNRLATRAARCRFDGLDKRLDGGN
jgi:hypothetical protein